MHKAISKYGLAAHLALLAVAPLFLFPFGAEEWAAKAVLWLSLLCTVWMLLEPSRRVDEMLHEARSRVFSSVLKDPVFWICVFLVAVSAVRCLNGGVSMKYDAEHSLWSVTQAAQPFLPGCVDGCGFLPFASVVSTTVIIQACRHALGKSARVCFLFSAAFLAAAAAVAAALICAFGGEESVRLALCSLADPTYAGTAFGLCLMGSMVAIVGSFERKWKRPMPLLAFAVGGSGLGLYLFAPDFVAVVYAAGTLLTLIYSLVYAQRRIGGLAVPKSLAFLLIAAVPPVLFVMGVVPASVKASKFAFLAGDGGAGILPEGFAQLRDLLTGIAVKVWREHPWNGTGLGSFGLDIRFNAADADWSVFVPGQAGALNGWMQMLAERGIAGLAFFLIPVLGLAAAWGARAFFAIREVFAAKHRRLGALIFHPVCVLGVLAPAATAACGFFDHSFWRAETVMLTAAMFAMAGSAFPTVKKAGDVPDGEKATEK